MTVTPGIETSIVRLLFEQAAAIGWTYLPLNRRTEMYNRWVRTPEIGGRLQKFMSPEETRVWIKDGPMKEYARAIAGFGKYADLVSNQSSTPRELVHRALGPGWEIDLETRAVKPLRLRIHKDDEELNFAWGPIRDLKHLVWAALTAEAGGDPTPWTLCLVASFERPITADERAAYLRLSRRCGLHITDVSDYS